MMSSGYILITGAGTGFGKETALRLAGDGHPVIAGVEIVAQVFELQEEAARRGVSLRVEKLDVTDPRDREAAWGWDVDALLNNAGVSEGGSIVDIPEENLRRQFEVNVIGPVLLTQGFARQMVKKRRGRIVFMSSVAGLTVDPFTGAYSGSKHAIEAVADALSQELAEFGVQVSTINPGPFLTGFNDRMFECWRRWKTDASERIFDYEKIAFPHEQLAPEPVIQTAIDVLTGQTEQYRNLVPKDMESETRQQQESAWQRMQPRAPGKRAELVQKAYSIAPGTSVSH